MNTRLSRPLVPVVLLSPPALVWGLTSVGWSPPLALTVAVLALIAVLTLIERRWPFRREWSEQLPSETATDVVYIALASVPDRLTRLAVEAAALGLLGWSVAEAPTVAVVQHANLSLEGGRQGLVNAPSYHRVHHHAEAQEARHNFASTLLVWEYLFGTLRRAPAPAVVGVEPTPHRLPAGYVGQLVSPWCGETLDTTCWLARFPWMVR